MTLRELLSQLNIDPQQVKPFFNVLEKIMLTKKDISIFLNRPDIKNSIKIYFEKAQKIQEELNQYKKI